MPDQHHEGTESPEPRAAEEANELPEPAPAEEVEEVQDEERRADKARRVITFAQVVVAVAQAVDAVIRIFS